MGLENLRVYKAAELLDRKVKALLAGLPYTDDVKQLLRALGSILFNIAEAFGSQYTGRKRYLCFAVLFPFGFGKAKQ
jgi:hypothetical protein